MSALSDRPRVVLLSAEPLAARMPGTAIRTYELGRALTPHAEVVLACPQGGEPLPGLEFPVIVYHRADPRPLFPELARATAVVAQPPWPHVAAALRRAGARLIFDLYNAEPFEIFETLADRSLSLRRVVNTVTLDRITAAMHYGDHFVCASEKQRDLWLGTMLAERLITPAVYDRDPSLRSVLAPVPFGVPAGEPTPSVDGARSRFDGVRADDDVVLWNGGIWDWLDAPIVVRAAAELAARRPRLRLVFMGASGKSQAQRATESARTIAIELGVLDRTVFFHDAWVPYDERGAWLLDADCAITTHKDHLETRFAFRTRMLDCFWAGLPVVCTRGDALADRVERDGLGEAVPPGDSAALAAALERVLDRGRRAYADSMARVREELSWERAAVPIVDWVGAAHRGEQPVARMTGNPRLAQRLRDVGVRAAFAALRTVGLQLWPSL
jgi:glycosyltransferase involved in cell wall biosynthesis